MQLVKQLFLSLVVKKGKAKRAEHCTDVSLHVWVHEFKQPQLVYLLKCIMAT